MPHFTLQITAGGPVLNAVVGVSDARQAALTQAGQPIPPGIPVRALVDTGASCTCVDPGVLAQLALTPTGTVPVCTPSTGNTPHTADQYDIGLAIPGATATTLPFYIPTVAVVAADLFATQGIHALIGRDILRGCVLHYNGTMGFFTLAF